MADDKQIKIRLPQWSGPNFQVKYGRTWFSNARLTIELYNNTVVLDISYMRPTIISTVISTLLILFSLRADHFLFGIILGVACIIIVYIIPVGQFLLCADLAANYLELKLKYFENDIIKMDL